MATENKTAIKTSIERSRDYRARIKLNAGKLKTLKKKRKESYLKKRTFELQQKLESAFLSNFSNSRDKLNTGKCEANRKIVFQNVIHTW